MRLVIVSDTHGHEPELPAGDVLVHAGDFTMMGTERQTWAARAWLRRECEKFEQVVVIAGNHDFFCELHPDTVARQFDDDGFHYLNDSGITIGGVNFWGSPITPWFHDWAFNRQRGEKIRRHWDLIPDDTDVLITHGPPARILDRNLEGQPCGCEDLRDAVKRVQPSIHAFGHIHEAHGGTMLHSLDTMFYNASYLDRSYRPRNSPKLVSLNLAESRAPSSPEEPR